MSFESKNKISTILTFGKYDEKKLHVSYSNETLKRSSLISKYIKSEWKKKKIQNPTIFPGNLAHVRNFEVDEKSIQIDTIHTTYDDYLVTCNQKFFNKFSSYDSANPLSVGALILTYDGKIILGKRNKDVATHKECITVPSGMVDEKDIVDGCKIDAFSAVKREIFEEIFLHQNKISTIFCMGLIFNRKRHQMFLPFFCKTGMIYEDILQSFDKNKSSSEFSAIFAISIQNDLSKAIRDMNMSDILLPTIEIFTLLNPSLQ